MPVVLGIGRRQPRCEQIPIDRGRRRVGRANPGGRALGRVCIVHFEPVVIHHPVAKSARSGVDLVEVGELRRGFERDLLDPGQGRRYAGHERADDQRRSQIDLVGPPENELRRLSLEQIHIHIGRYLAAKRVA